MSTDPRYATKAGRPYSGYSRSIKLTAIALVFLGVLALASWHLTNNDSTTSMLLLLAGISIIVLAVMLYFLSPEKYLSSEVADAMASSNMQNLSRLLSALFIETGGIYVPASESGMIKVFIPISPLKTADMGTLRTGNETLSVSGSGVKGISLVPPGYGLYRYAQSMGAVFTADGLEGEIKDVLVNGLEMASSVNVRREGDRITVSMRGLADAGLCTTVRKECPRICSQTGCPICSFIGCMVVSGTGRKARIEGADASDRAVTVTYGLL